MLTVRIVATVLFVSTQIPAVEPGMPSKTSIGAAAARAVGSHDPDPAIRNPDWLAEHFLGPAERALLVGQLMDKALEQDYREAIQRPEVAQLVRSLLVRTRFIDERLENAVRAGATQIVILGAGFDSRAYRLKQLLSNTRVIEVDYGPTQEYKKRRVLEVLGGVPSNLVYAPIDFTKEKLSDVLQAAGYRPAEKTFFIGEGVSMYLPEEAVLDTLRFVASQSGPGSSIVFDFLSKSFVASLAQAPVQKPRSDVLTVARHIARRVSAMGEPWIFGLPDDREHEFLRNVGLQATRFLATYSAEATKQYATRRDGSTIQIPPHTGRSYHWLAEAVVRGQ